MNEKVNARIQALEAELAGLKKELAEPKKEGRFRAERGGIYSTVFTDKGKYIAIQQSDTQNSVDESRHDNFNYFRPDTEEADRMAEKINLLLAMTARVKELNGDWVADWENQNTKKWGIKNSKDGYKVDWCIYYNCNIFNLSVQSKEHAEILLNEFKERIEKYY